MPGICKLAICQLPALPPNGRKHTSKPPTTESTPTFPHRRCPSFPLSPSTSSSSFTTFPSPSVDPRQPITRSLCSLFTLLRQPRYTPFHHQLNTRNPTPADWVCTHYNAHPFLHFTFTNTPNRIQVWTEHRQPPCQTANCHQFRLCDTSLRKYRPITRVYDLQTKFLLYEAQQSPRHSTISRTSQWPLSLEHSRSAQSVA